MILTPIEFLTGLVVTLVLMACATRVFRASPYRSLAGAVGMLVAMMVIEIYAKAMYGEAYPATLSWIVARTVFASILGAAACYRYRDSRYREWVSAAGVVVGFVAARVLFS